MKKGYDEFRSALDCNGFPLEVGDLVEMTALLDEKNKGTQGVVARVASPNICYVQMERQISFGLGRELYDADRAEVVAAAGFLWKLLAKGAS